MAAQSMNSIRELARLHGIAAAYVDYRGRPCEVSVRSQAAILGALGVEAGDEHAALASIRQYETMRWTRFLPPVVVATLGEPVVVPVAVPLELEAKSLEWSLTLDRKSVV